MSDKGKGKSHRARRFVVFLVIIAVVLVVLDRGGDLVAERITADNLQSSQNLDQRPDVSIDGVPFLTQFASGHYEHVVVDAQNVPIAKSSVFLARFHADFRTVTVSRSFDNFHARTARASARIAFSTLTRLLKVSVSYAGNGRLKISKNFDLIGRKTVTFKASYANGALRFGSAAVNGLGNLGSSVSSELNNLFGIKAPLQGIPFKVKVRSVRIDRQGLEIALSGRNLTYRSAGN